MYLLLHGFAIFAVLHLALGMKVLCKTFPVGTITGQVPVSCLPSPTRARKPARTPSSGTLQSTAQPFFQHKDCFTPEGSLQIKITLTNFLFTDLIDIQEKLDEILLPSECCFSSQAYAIYDLVLYITLKFVSNDS